LVSEGRGIVYRRKDGKFLLYLPMDFVEDSMFPFPVVKEKNLNVKVSFKHRHSRLLVEKWTEPS
jgi:hypothetical protein